MDSFRKPLARARAREAPTVEEIRDVLEAGEEIPESAHMALDYGGIHPNPEHL